MARGYKGAFGGSKINSPYLWLGLCAAFLIGLVDWRRLASVRNVDLLVLVSLTVSLWFFNHGNIFAAMPFVYPGLVWMALHFAQAKVNWLTHDVGDSLIGTPEYKVSAVRVERA